MGFANVRAGTRVLMLVLVQAGARPAVRRQALLDRGLLSVRDDKVGSFFRMFVWTLRVQSEDVKPNMPLRLSPGLRAQAMNRGPARAFRACHDARAGPVPPPMSSALGTVCIGMNSWLSSSMKKKRTILGSSCKAENRFPNNPKPTVVVKSKSKLKSSFPCKRHENVFSKTPFQYFQTLPQRTRTA